MIVCNGVSMPIKTVHSLFSFTFEELLSDIYQQELKKVYSNEYMHFFNIAANEFGNLSKKQCVHLAVVLHLAYDMWKHKFWHDQWSGYLNSDISTDTAAILKKELHMPSKYSAIAWNAFLNENSTEMCALLISKLHIHPSDVFPTIGYDIVI